MRLTPHPSSAAPSDTSVAGPFGASFGGVETAVAAAHEASRAFIDRADGVGRGCAARSGVGMDASLMLRWRA